MDRNEMIFHSAIEQIKRQLETADALTSKINYSTSAPQVNQLRVKGFEGFEVGIN